MDIACFYVGFGAVRVREAARYMAASVRKAMPEARLVHLTDRVTPPLDGFDKVYRADVDVAWNKLCYAKALAMAGFAAQTKVNAVLVDPDVIFNRSVADVFDLPCDVAIPWRQAKGLHKRYNAGLVYTRPTEPARKFWKTYHEAVVASPAEIHGWWIDQIAFAMMLGSERTAGGYAISSGACVHLLDYVAHCPKPVPSLTGIENAAAVHFSGDNRKPLMRDYARSIGLDL